MTEVEELFKTKSSSTSFIWQTLTLRFSSSNAIYNP